MSGNMIGKTSKIEEEGKLDELEEAIVVHIYRFGPDTPWLMARRMLGNSGWKPKIDEDQIIDRCRRMESMGLLERYDGNLKWRATSSVTSSHAKARELPALLSPSMGSSAIWELVS